ncbi:MAG TPA: glycolate oxidase subunit GlcF [Burkholderiaceae bacterium]|nr:glycolate oxidase subunit GlcF [Burkholderiaceae bacterium]
METKLADWIKDTPQGQEAQAILRSCVHCGFCLATCPTYQLLGDELDGPRGRIYLIKQVLEGAEVTRTTQLHLDRCLTCRNCETTCPSGVQYGRLIDIGRDVVDQRVPRDGADRMKRRILLEVLPRPQLFGAAMKLGRMMRPLLPGALKSKVPAATRPLPWPTTRHQRKMLVLAGCVQPGMAPSINAATARVLDHFGIQLNEVARAGCCGALRYHLTEQEAGLDDMRRNIDAWWPDVQQGVEAIVMTASGCGAMVKEYGHLLRDDPRYAQKAKRISELTLDVCEVMTAELAQLDEKLAATWPDDLPKTIAFHSPCTLQHGQQIRGVTEKILSAAGFELQPVLDAHLCCGSAGTYSVLQPGLSEQLRNNKLENLEASRPQAIATANIGCLTHLQSGTATPVTHWIELLERRIAAVT